MDLIFKRAVYVRRKVPVRAKPAVFDTVNVMEY